MAAVWGGTAAYAEDDPAAVEVEWVIIGTDTFGDAIERAVANQEAAAVSAALDDFALAASSGQSVEFPGLESLPADHLIELANETADAVANSAPLPRAAEELELDPAASAAVAADQPLGEIINNGATYRQYNWIQRGITTGTGTVRWTDRVQLRWQTNPGAVTSNVSYNTTYSLSSGYFSNLRVRTRAFTNSTPVADTMWRPSDVGYVVRPIDNSQELYGKPIHHVAEFAATSPTGQVYSDQQSTAIAVCDTQWGQCFYS